MINGIGSTPKGRIEGLRSGATQRGGETSAAKAATAIATATVAGEAAEPSAAATLAAAGPPVDTAKVEAVRTAIANGSFRIDPKAIAERMVDLDLPKS